ncbi:mechanosensitive ion channel family protein [Gracilibacillus sp. S3-1-1]|uniref:Mechanosensitive ion channel family protein n=1 Tax=Gracilibacillus pellucidus TaxID=3095368 RepID=A0ACC6M556_9BACI|nr:mechanosensitive ion channel family protein [Gracilibacillus sp. S3-1-1]MDX8046040.1 mechanosensitive ion channel family protein [Gracilibacillus sp. S3-1-1]
MNWKWKFWESISSEDYIHIAISVGIILFSFLLRKIFIKYIYYLLVKVARKGKNDFFNYMLSAFEKPLQVLIIIIGVYVSMGYFPYINQDNDIFGHLIRVSVILMITWGLYNLSSSSSLLFMKISDAFNFEIDEILIPFLSKAVRVIIIAISLSIIAQEFDYDVSGFVAGLGLGGLAFALAAQEVIKNLFGGVVIITEKPFSIGDWIETPTIEGVVEDINFRSTIVRTFADSLITIPNSTLSNEPITNWSKMGKRRITFNLGVEYSTTKEQLEIVIRRIREYLENSEDIHPETIFVRFSDYNDSSLDIMLYFFTNTIDFDEHLKVKEDVNFKIMEILEEENVSVAFPSRTIYMDQDNQETIKTVQTQKE